MKRNETNEWTEGRDVALRRVASRRAVTQHVATRRVATQLVAKIFSLTLAIHGILNLIPSSATMSDGIASQWRTKEEEPQDGRFRTQILIKPAFWTCLLQELFLFVFLLEQRNFRTCLLQKGFRRSRWCRPFLFLVLFQTIGYSFICLHCLFDNFIPFFCLTW